MHLFGGNLLSQQPFWSGDPAELCRQLQCRLDGLSTDEAAGRLTRYGRNTIAPRRHASDLHLLLKQFTSPIVLLLIGAALLSIFLRETTDAVIILSIITVSGVLGFWQEHAAADAIQKLLEMVRVRASVLRDGQPREIPLEQVVPGDIVLLAAGDSVPGDCRLLESRDLFLDQAALTGETFPVEKLPGALPSETALASRGNIAYMGTHVVSGTGKALVVRTGTATEFGTISQHLRLRPPESEFERGVRRFGFFLMEITLLLVIFIFGANVYLQRPPLDSFLFAIALAVGLTPQLLPAVVAINLAQGAKRMAKQRVIVRRLSSIENFGSMNVLCSDKTGTLTEGIVRLHSARNADGEESPKVALFGYLNAKYQTGFANPIDKAICEMSGFSLEGYSRLDEIPYDFIRKRLSMLVSKESVSGGSVSDPAGSIMITKGAVANVLAVCTTAERNGERIDLAQVRNQLDDSFDELSSHGFRTLGVAYRELGSQATLTREEERDMVFLGLLVFFDPPRVGIEETVAQLRSLGVSLKIITGDNAGVAGYLGRQVGLSSGALVCGRDLHEMSDEAIRASVNRFQIFAEIEPNQKERIILALKKAGNVVGYLGDGINDAPALHAADVGISVDTAVDVAKGAADMVLLEKNLSVLIDGVREGRRTFANTLKYVFMATSANFGNMFSMAGASLFLPFLPLLPKQILITNLLTDFPEMTIAKDSVDEELLAKPRRWDIGFIRRFMITFGLLSSVFDYATFGVLLLVLHAGTREFRTGWFVESVLSASLIVLVIRTHRFFLTSKPHPALLGTTLAVAAATLLLPYTPVARMLDFGPLPPAFLLALIGILVLYVLSAELVKRLFYSRLAQSTVRSPRAGITQSISS
jgi:P-type Mg2+ transporter